MTCNSAGPTVVLQFISHFALAAVGARQVDAGVRAELRDLAIVVVPADARILGSLVVACRAEADRARWGVDTTATAVGVNAVFIGWNKLYYFNYKIK